MAAALLRAAVTDTGEPVTVASTGLLGGRRPVPSETAKALAPYGAEVAGHRSTALSAEAVEAADLILTMERRHAREVVLLVPAAWPRTFTLKDFVRRAEKLGPRADRPLRVWAAAVSDGRERTDLVGSSLEDDVADPFGGGLTAYRATASELADLVQRLVRLAWSVDGRHSA
jgi:protein-tyrosine phosphatase